MRQHLHEHLVLGTAAATIEHFIGEGLMVTISGPPAAEMVTVTKGWIEFNPDHGWLREAGHTTHRFELPIDVTLHVPQHLVRPNVCFAWNHTTKKAGVYISDHALLTPELAMIEILAVRHGDDSGHWMIRHFYLTVPQIGTPDRSLAERPHPTEVHHLFGGHPDTHQHFARHIDRNRKELAAKREELIPSWEVPDA